MDDFRKMLYGVIIGFIAIIVGWVSFLTFSGCGFSLNNCNASVPKIQRTSIPSLVPATSTCASSFSCINCNCFRYICGDRNAAPTESAATAVSTIASSIAASVSLTSTSPVAASALTPTNASPLQHL